MIESHLNVRIVTRDGWLQVDGEEEAIEKVEAIMILLQDARSQGLKIRNPDFKNVLEGVVAGREEELRALFDKSCVIQTRRSTIVPKTLGQKKYLQSIFENDIVFGIGPAGTGKTYLAMAAAVAKLLDGSIKRLILSRPAV